MFITLCAYTCLKYSGMSSISLTTCQTYIGPVLISVNPFKDLPIYTSKEVDMYQGGVSRVDLWVKFVRYSGKSLIAILASAYIYIYIYIFCIYMSMVQ